MLHYIMKDCARDFDNAHPHAVFITFVVGCLSIQKIYLLMVNIVSLFCVGTYMHCIFLLVKKRGGGGRKLALPPTYGANSTPPALRGDVEGRGRERERGSRFYSVVFCRSTFYLNSSGASVY